MADADSAGLLQALDSLTDRIRHCTRGSWPLGTDGSSGDRQAAATGITTMMAHSDKPRFTERWLKAGRVAGPMVNSAALRTTTWLPQPGTVARYAATLLTLGLAACASEPQMPTPEMTRAEGAIAQARVAGAEQLANEPLLQAEAQLAKAKEAVAQHNSAEAAKRVEEAYADAKLADLAAQSAKAAKASAEADKSILTLQQEAARDQTP
jgi:hypothetical protein